MTNCSDYQNDYNAGYAAIDPNKHYIRVQNKIAKGYNDTFCVACSNVKIGGVTHVVTNKVELTQGAANWLHNLDEAQHSLKGYMHASLKGARKTESLEKCKETCEFWMRKCCAGYMVDY